MIIMVINTQVEKHAKCRLSSDTTCFLRRLCLFYAKINVTTVCVFMSPSIAIGFCLDQHYIEIKQPFSHAVVTVMRLAATACFVGARIQPHILYYVVTKHVFFFRFRVIFVLIIIRVFLG